jgi:hypothetical protein
MDISRWSETQVQAWTGKDRMARVRDIEQTHTRPSPSGLESSTGGSDAAARNLTQLVLLDVEARATHAADVVASAIKGGVEPGSRPDDSSKRKERTSSRLLAMGF